MKQSTSILVDGVIFFLLSFFAQLQLLEVLNSPIRKNVFTLDLQYFLSLKGMFRYEFNHC